MDTARLRAFVAVADHGGFSAAAGHLFKTQPAVSQAVAALEAELGVRLFHRLGRQVVLTEAGRILLAHAREAFGVLAQAQARIEGLGELRTGRLAIGTSDTTACYLLPPVLRDFRTRYPGVEITISNRPSPLTVEHVLSRQVDVGIVTLPVRSSRLVVQELVSREDVLIVCPRSALAGRRRVRLRDMAGVPLLLLDHGSSTRAFIDDQFRAAGLEPTVVMELASIEVIKQLVRLDFGASIVPVVAARREVRQGRLRAKRIFPRTDARRLGVVYPAKGFLSPAAQEFVALLARRLKSREAG
jgi:DNA-binding transcriptional LysR family regulator